MSDTDKTAPPAALPWGLRVRALRTAANLTQDELAQRAGTTKATISKIERSTKRPGWEWMEKLASALGIDIGELALGREAAAPAAAMIPVIGMIAAGNWREAIQTPEEMIHVVDPRPHMFALRVDGDSVDQIAPDGAYVSIDPTNPTLVPGALYAVQNGQGESTLKRFRNSPDRLEPASSNPVHQPIILGSEPITIVGRATSVIQML